MSDQRGSDESGARQKDISLAATLFVALMFLTISAVNLYMQRDRSLRPGGANQERAGAANIDGIDPMGRHRQ
jgi:hypothetical protein